MVATFKNTKICWQGERENNQHQHELVIPDRVVGGAREEVLGLPVDVETPDGSLVAVVGSQPLAVDGVPDVGLPVLGAGEEQVTFAVVLDLGDGLFVTVQADGLHDGGSENEKSNVKHQVEWICHVSFD